MLVKAAANASATAGGQALVAMRALLAIEGGRAVVAACVAQSLVAMEGVQAATAIDTVVRVGLVVVPAGDMSGSESRPADRAVLGPV